MTAAAAPNAPSSRAASPRNPRRLAGPAEASVGINSKAVVRGLQREDKNILGSMHFGLGTNIDVGGTIHSKIHMDGVVLEPTLYVDGDKRI